jgi:hypothetical protein
MRANVQYNDYVGTTAADRCDMFIDRPDIMTSIIMEKFDIKLNPEEYKFVGVSVNGTMAKDMLVYVFFKELTSDKVVKCNCYSKSIQTVLDLFKRFEFQVGECLEDIDNYSVKEMTPEGE